MRDPALVVELVAATVGVQDQSVEPLREVLAGVLASHTALLVLDNCEQVIEAVAGLTQSMLTRCPKLRILATSREPLNIGGEAVVRIAPLTTPEPEDMPSLREARRFDAMGLFTERAASALPGFELTDENRRAVAGICARLEGLPLAVELAASRIRALTPQQILQRLNDRYVLLNLGSRSAPTRQQTLRLSIGWSYDMCTPAEQQLWTRLSVFAGSTDLDGAAEVCAGDGATASFLDTVTALVDKSILIREESHGEVRFRMLETLRDYARGTIENADQYMDLARRHQDWYQRLTLTAESEWISTRQLEWIAKLERELPNLREVLEFSLTVPDGSALRIAASLYQFWLSRGRVSEGRRWLARALAQPGQCSILEHAKAIFAAAELAAVQGDLVTARFWVDEGRALDLQSTDLRARSFIAITEGFVALTSGDLDRAQTCLEETLGTTGIPSDFSPQIYALLMLGWVHQLGGRQTEALAEHEQVLSITESRGESVYRSYALAAMGMALWRDGDREHAVQRLEEALLLTRPVGNLITTSTCLQALAWIAFENGASRRTAVLMGAAAALSQAVGSPTVLFPSLLPIRARFEQSARRDLGTRVFEAAYREGGSMDLDAAIAFALGERHQKVGSARRTTTNLTKREHEVANLIAEGLTNKEIAARLVLSKRTVEGHVEHTLAKLGFTSRAQIAAWVVANSPDSQRRIP
ncbi:protein kinase/ LuxR family transcriptional regulator [Rhodococcus triatomae BKS 15-14]|nr:protein kinase/ LuxR family transcriptional regulator [Rhodococcus triatomae BKS 15-14]